ncbi:unnamed protein product [Orchesella dallaii]|uniref:AMP-dependent synthetase/ligase domain-containing protein n=1 Tax=Orchesella dallaii TaxID=48710 RepID=A0ABP1QKH3_9HEXA
MNCSQCFGGFMRAPQSILRGIDFPLPRITIPEYFRDCLIKNTIKNSAPAILGDGHQVAYTFQQLDSLATKMGKALRKYLGYWTSNNQDGDLVMAFCLPVSQMIPVVILSILKLGAAYLSIPLSHDLIIVKLIAIVRPMLVITESCGPALSRFDSVRHLVNVVGIDEILKLAESGEFDDMNEVVPLETLVKTHKRVACIVYTAGTRDEQQGVRIGHGEILNRCLWQYQTFPYKQNEVASLCSALEDVDSISEIFAPLLAGIPIYLIPKHDLEKPLNLIQKIHKKQISRIVFVPPALNSLLNAYEEMHERSKLVRPLGSLKHWIITGDSLKLELAKRFFNFLEQEKASANSLFPAHHHTLPMLIHYYGSTEVTGDVSYEIFDDITQIDSKFNQGNVSIGRPIANTIIYIVDDEMNLAEEGAQGEICIAGSPVAFGGYINGTTTENTKRFCVNPFTKKTGYTCMFMTGDYGRIIENKDGISHLHYEGRTDLTAKIKGRRIDLKDITQIVQGTNLVEQCFVFCYHREREDQTLVACCKLLPDVSIDKLEEVLRKEIVNEHIIPEVYPVDEFHYLASGRLDRHKLLKQYQYFRMDTTKEEWESLHLSPPQMEAAKVLFKSVAYFTRKSLRYVIRNKESPLWCIGVNSLNAVGIFLNLQEHSYEMHMEQFLTAKSLINLVNIMVSESGTKIRDTRSTLEDFAMKRFKIASLEEKDKDTVIQLLCNAYINKYEAGSLISLKKEDWNLLLEWNWKDIVTSKLSLVALTRKPPEEAKIVAAVIVFDACNIYYGRIPSKCLKPLSYLREIKKFCDAGPREHIVGKSKGTVIQIALMGTSSSVSTMDNILLISLMLEAAIVGAKNMGYSGAMTTTSNPLQLNLCEGVFHFDLIKEVQINQFRSKDKTKPFRMASDHQKLHVLYRRL